MDPGLIRLAASYTTDVASMAYDLVGESCNEAPVFPLVGKIPRGHRIENCGIWEKKRTLERRRRIFSRSTPSSRILIR